MKMRKFRSRAKANKVARVLRCRAIRVRAAKLADGTKGAIYRFKKRKGKR